MIKDKHISIATGNSCKAKNWKNTDWTWGALADRLRRVTRTGESFDEYLRMDKDLKSRVKDVGGFVGGYTRGGLRTDLSFRSVLCLDADFAEPGRVLWDKWLEVFNTAAVLYSTHSHTPEQPRLRLVIPFDTPISPEEYEPVARRVAFKLGIDQFDDSTYQPQRLMYWPSASSDAEFVYELCESDTFLDGKAVLGEYVDWRDVSAWPTSSRQSEIRKKEVAKQVDPLTKQGLIGAFCRAYSIEDAIAAFVPDYAPLSDGRYTYTPGTTSGGVICYDGKFSYSHHATDPASAQLCNAWDLVRLHKFGQLDDPEKDYQDAKRPSYKAMESFAESDSKTRLQVVNDSFGDDAAEDEDDESWKKRIEVDNKGHVMSTINNAVLILEHHPDFAGRLGYDEMISAIVVTGDLPWRTADNPRWTDTDDSQLRLWFEKNLRVSGKDKLIDAVAVAAAANTFHPLREYLHSLAWDGVQRLDTLFVEYLGAADSAYTRAITRKTLVGAVARAFNPGCKFDYVLTIHGNQGLGKSALMGKLGGKWFSDTFLSTQGKESYEQLQGVWIMEIGELAGLRRAEVEAIKSYITKQRDTFRPPYGRHVMDFPRQCIFIGTTNDPQFLRDTTGNRRFWVLDTPKPKKKDWSTITQEEIDQVWAEAVVRYKAGEPLYLTGALADDAQLMQQTFEEDNPVFGQIAAYLSRTIPDDWYKRSEIERQVWLDDMEEGTVEREYISNIEIVKEVFNGGRSYYGQNLKKDIKDAMTRMPGWSAKLTANTYPTPYGPQRVHLRLKED